MKPHKDRRDRRTWVTVDEAVREANYRRRLAEQKNAQLGRTIHTLRCELAEAREINGKIARGEMRGLERDNAKLLEQVALDGERLAAARAENAALREKLAAVHE